MTVNKEYSNILNDLKYDDKVWFLINCYDKPNIFIKCYGIIRNTEVKQNNVRYHIELLNILEDKNTLLKNVQNQSFRTYIHKTKRARLKTIQIIDIVDKINFSELLQIRLNKYHFVVNNFLCTKSETELIELYNKTNEITKNILFELSQ